MSGLPDRPDLDQLRRQARELLRAAVDGEPRAAGRLRAVSPRVTLSAAQLALGSRVRLPELDRAESRSSTPPLVRHVGGPVILRRGYCPPDPAGVLLPEILIAGASQAVLHGSLTLSGNSQLAGAVPRGRVPAPGALLARLVPRRSTGTRDLRAEASTDMESMRALTSGTIVDDRGARYAFREGAHLQARGAGQVRAPEGACGPRAGDRLDRAGRPGRCNDAPAALTSRGRADRPARTRPGNHGRVVRHARRCAAGRRPAALS